MHNPTLLSLTYLLQSGYTHHDLKTLFSHQNSYSPEDVWASLQDGIIIGDMHTDRHQTIREKYKKVDTQAIDTLIMDKGIDIIPMNDPRYPDRLKNIGHAPYFLYVRGTLRTDIPLIGIVGSRKGTPYAHRILEKIIPDTIHAGVGIISGGATGVDSLAHHITLEHGGYTIAVFGTGIDRCYPAGNKSLFENIILSGGAVISHFPIGTGPEVYNFPIRNEIVAGIGRGILIPEAALSSGTLITAQLALEHGRDVFAVPGDIDRPTSEGANMLIATGQAKCVRCSGDILEEYFDVESIGSGMTPIVRPSPIFDDEKEKKVYEAITQGYQTVDTLLSMIEMEMTDLLMVIAMLEISGYIRLSEMGKYEISS